MRDYIYIFIILLMGILYIACSTIPIRIVDSNKYMVILDSPDKEVIIQTMDGRKFAFGYVELKEK